MPPFRMASFLSPLISASRFCFLAQTRKRAHHQVDVFVFKLLNDVQIGFLRSGHTRMSKTPGNARNGNARNNSKEACVCRNPWTEMTGMLQALQCLPRMSFTVEL